MSEYVVDFLGSVKQHVEGMGNKVHYTIAVIPGDQGQISVSKVRDDSGDGVEKRIESIETYVEVRQQHLAERATAGWRLVCVSGSYLYFERSADD